MAKLAQQLQWGLAMKSIVGIVATLVLFTGCGVGVDDPEGMAAAGLPFAQGQSALISGMPQGGAAVVSPLVVNPGGTAGAPVDPIPFLEGKRDSPMGDGTLPMDLHSPRPLR